MISPPAGVESSASHFWLPVARSVRDESQCEASPVLFPRPGSPGGLRGCVSPSLGQPGRLSVSTLSSSREGGGSSQRDPQSLHDSGRPPLAGKGVVRRPLLLLTHPPLALPWWDWLLRQPHFNRFNHGVHALNLHSW